MSVAAGVSDAAIAVREKLRGRIAQTKVKRYWPGKAPEWADDEEGGPGGLFASRDEDEGDEADRGSRRVLSAREAAEDARLRRLGESRRDREGAVARHREIRAAEIVQAYEDERREKARAEQQAEEEEEDEDLIEQRRRAIRERLLARQREEEELGREEEEEEEEDDEEDSEYETDSEDEEEEGGLAMIKPVFVPKSERDTVAEREKLEEEERELEEAVKRRMEERRQETKQLVVEEIRREEERERRIASGEEEADIRDVNTDDEENEAEEFEGWRQREIARIKREREEREALAREKEEREHLANMTEEERREWERKNPKVTTAAPKKKWKFMQKYYHRGAFFQEAADDRGGSFGGDQVYRRDFSAPTGEDRLDKSILPKVMQVKNFGRSGRSKWTHLVNEDTTQWDTPWANNDPLRAKYTSKMAGMKQDLAKPKGSKKLKDWDVK